MILVTRLTGAAFAVNPDLLERVEATPDTVLTLIDAHDLAFGTSRWERVVRSTQLDPATDRPVVPGQGHSPEEPAAAGPHVDDETGLTVDADGVVVRGADEESEEYV